MFCCTAPKKDRSKNLIIYGVEGKDNEKLKEKVESFFEEIREKPHVRKVCTAGVKKPDIMTTRAIKFTL